MADGADVRFSSGATPLKYQIEEWDAASGRASIWVLIPNIKGNAVQPLTYTGAITLPQVNRMGPKCSMGPADM
jgi:hypothetical protein